MSDSDPKDKPGRPPGGVRHDGRGNAVWQWAAESGRHLLDSTSRLLKRLEVPGLSVEGEESEEEQQQKQLELKEQRKASGYNPYETTRGTPAGSRGVNARTPAKAAPPKPAAPKPAQPQQPAAKQGSTKLVPPAVEPPTRSWLGKMFKKD